MAVFDLSGPTRAVGKLGSGLFMVIQPLADGLEALSASSSNMVRDHAANVAAKAKRQEAVRKEEHAAMFRKAVASAKRKTIAVDEFEQSVQMDVGAAAFKARIHAEKLALMANIPDSVVKELASRSNLTNTDILRAINVGSFVSETKESGETTKGEDPFDISAWS